jgi:hypothetical protein
LRTDLTYVRDEDIFISVENDYQPSGLQYPAVGLKDGTIRRKELASGLWEETQTVTVILFQEHGTVPGTSVVGDGGTKKGLLEIAEDIHESLDDTTLGLAGVTQAVSLSESGSARVPEETGTIQKKEITYRYVTEAVRPGA